MWSLCGVVLWRAHPTWEGAWWNVVFATGFAGLTLLCVIAAYRLYLGWKGVERLTAAVLTVPMAGAFDRLPDKVSRLFGRYLLASRRRLRDREVLVHLRERAVRAVREACDGRAAGRSSATSLALFPDPPADGRAAAALAAYAAWKAAEADTPPGGGREPDSNREEDDVADLCRLSARFVGALEPAWAADGRPVGAAIGTVPVEAGKESPDPDGWVAWVEQFVAVMAVVYLSQYLVRMRRLAVMAAATAGALLTAATSYQFQPEGLIMNAGLILAAGVAGLILWVLTEINRNELVSRITRSAPNRFSLDAAFLSNVATLVLPLVLVISAQFAGRTRAVVEPVLGWFR
jgi:hypothetical protein